MITVEALALQDMAPPLRAKICLVCGADGARFNYQAYTCENCRVFFFRIVTGKLRIADCRSKCSISHENSKNCKSCRYKTCINNGMQASEVGKRRGAQSAHFVCQPIKKSQITQNYNLVNYGTKAAYRLRISKTAAEFIGILYDFEIITGAGKNILQSFANLDISIQELILKPGACSSTETSVFYPVCYEPSIKEVDYKLCYARSVTAFSEFMTAIDEFHCLQMKDKIALFKANYLIYTHSEVVFRQYICKKKNFITYSYIPYSNKNTPEGYWYQRSQIFRSYTLSPIQLFLEMDISIEEYLFLRLIAMFYNSAMLSIEGQIVIIRAREKYTIMLAEYLKTRFSPEETTIRMANILSLIRFFEKLSIYGKEKHAHMVINNIGNLDGLLSRQLHIMGDDEHSAEIMKCNEL